MQGPELIDTICPSDDHHDVRDVHVHDGVSHHVHAQCTNLGSLPICKVFRIITTSFSFILYLGGRKIFIATRFIIYPFDAANRGCKIMPVKMYCQLSSGLHQTQIVWTNLIYQRSSSNRYFLNRKQLTLLKIADG